MAPVLDEYFQKKCLAEIGYSFNSDELTVFEAESFTIISSTLSELENKRMKKDSKGK